MILDPRKRFRLTFGMASEDRQPLVNYTVTLTGDIGEQVSDLIFKLFTTLDALYNGEQINACTCLPPNPLHDSSCHLYGM